MTRQDDLAEALIDGLADALDIPISRYDSANKRYKSVSAWLSRPESYFVGTDVNVYIQGSFRLGTAIRPIGDMEHYDLDIVCEFKLPKHAQTQASLHRALGDELRLYATRYDMKEPEGWDRCWTLNYADEARFHMDILPSVPDGAGQVLLLKAANLSSALADTSVAITDKTHPFFNVVSSDWSISNPNGYAKWFQSRMAPSTVRKRLVALRDAVVNVAEMQYSEAKTPLQSAVQILKRHRDMRFSESLAKVKPSSVIISTLASHAYQQEPTVSGALRSILSNMHRFIEDRRGESWIVNPSAPRENFADCWRTTPELKDAFFDWLDTAKWDFAAAAREADSEGFVDVLAPRMGRHLMASAVQKSRTVLASKSLMGRAMAVVARPITAMTRILDAPHRRPATWPYVPAGTVEIATARCIRSGFRPERFFSESTVPKRASLEFQAETDVRSPYRVYWQVVNTGQQAREVGNLRGELQEDSVARGHLKKVESTQYAGTHSVECFIVKDGNCVAKSGPFIVNIQ